MLREDDASSMTTGTIALVVSIVIVSIVWTVTSVQGAFEAAGFGSRKPAKNSEIAFGTLVSATQTGVFMNEQPQMALTFDVQPLNGPAFQGIAKTIVPLHELHAIKEGMLLPLRITPGKTKVKLAEGENADHMNQLLLQHQLKTGAITPMQAQIAQEGTQAQAVILGFSPTGEIRGNATVATVDVRVSRPDGTSFDMTVEKAFPANQLHLVQTGRIVNVQYLEQIDNDLVFALPLDA